MAEEGTPKTRFLRVVDNSKFRMAFTVFLCLLMFGDLVLAGMSFKYYPKSIYGALAWQIVLSVISIAYSGFFLWRNLDGVTKKRSWLYLGLNAGMICLWLSAFFSLAILLGMTGNGKSDSSNNDSSNSSNSNSNNNQGNNQGTTQGGSRRLAVRDTTAQSANFYPAIGCVVMNLFFAFMFLVNLAYIYFRMTTLFPKYAEIVEDGHAFDTQMADTQHHDEESHETANGSAQGGFSSYGRYDGQNDYRPGGRVNQHARYDAELDANDTNNTYSGRISPIPYPIPAAGESPYQNTGYHGQTAYGGHQTAYGSQPHPGRKVSPTPYPRSSVMGDDDYRDV